MVPNSKLPLPPQNETANRVPNSKPPLPPQNETTNRVPNLKPLKHEYYRFLSIQVYSNLPKIGRQCTPPAPGMKKLDTGQSDVLVLADVPPPLSEKVGHRSK